MAAGEATSDGETRKPDRSLSHRRLTQCRYRWWWDFTQTTPWDGRDHG